MRIQSNDFLTALPMQHTYLCDCVRTQNKKRLVFTLSHLKIHLCNLYRCLLGFPLEDLLCIPLLWGKPRKALPELPPRLCSGEAYNALKWPAAFPVFKALVKLTETAVKGQRMVALCQRGTTRRARGHENMNFSSDMPGSRQLNGGAANNGQKLLRRGSQLTCQQNLNEYYFPFPRNVTRGFWWDRWCKWESGWRLVHPHSAFLAGREGATRCAMPLKK